MKIRPLELDDCHSIAAWLDEDPNIVPSMRLPEQMSSVDLEMALLKTIGSDAQRWFVVERGDDVVAAVGMTHFDVETRSAQVHQCVSPHHRYGKTALSVINAAKEYARDVLGLERLIGFVPRELDGKPHPALRLDMAAGFEPQELEVLLLRLTPAEDDDGT